MWLDVLKDAIGLGIRKQAPLYSVNDEEKTRCYLMIAAGRGPGTTRWRSLLRFLYERG